MELFSDCIGKCCVCAIDGCCLAGIGDDDYIPASKETVIRRLKNWEYPNFGKMMIQYLKEKYDYEWCE